MKTVFIIAIVAVAMIGVMVPSVFAQSDVIFGKTVIENVTPSEESVFKPITIKPFQNTYVKNSDMKFNIRILDSFDKPIFIILKDSEKNILYTKEVFAPTGEINVKLRLDFIPLLARGDLLELIVSHNENQQNKKFYIILYDIRFNQFDKNGNPEAYTWTDTATLTAILPEANLDPLNIDSVHMGSLYTVSGCTGTLILYETGIDTMEFDVMIQFIPYNEETIFEESCFTQISNSPTATLIVKENDGVQTGLQWQGMGVGLGAMIKPLEKEIIQHIHGFHIAYDVPEYKELLQIIGDKELSGSGSVSALIEFPDGTIKSEKTQFEEDGSFEILFDLPVNSIVGIYGVSIFDNSGVIDNIQIIVTDKKPFGSKTETVEETLIVNAPVIETPITPELISEPEPLGIASFVDQSKDPQHYIDRYNNEPSYKEWFDENYPQYSSIYQAVGLEEPIVEQTNEPEYVSEPEYTPEPDYVSEPTITQTTENGADNLTRKLILSSDNISNDWRLSSSDPVHDESMFVLYHFANTGNFPGFIESKWMGFMRNGMTAGDYPKESLHFLDLYTYQFDTNSNAHDYWKYHVSTLRDYEDNSEECERQYPITDHTQKLYEFCNGFQSWTPPFGTVNAETQCFGMYDEAKFHLNVPTTVQKSPAMISLYCKQNDTVVLAITTWDGSSGGQLVQEEHDNEIKKELSNFISVIFDGTSKTSTIQTEEKSKGGGCLIATATYGSELAPQVQQLRELRDNQLLQTESGTAFMGTFNDIYYSFSPIIADYERENPYFKEAVKIAITPMISTLSLMENANSESEVLSIGISVIALNLGMYLGVPAIVVIGIRKIK